MAEPTGGSYTPPQFNFGAQIADLPKSYWDGLEQAYKRRQQDAFKDGIPLGSDGQPDWSAIATKTLQVGGTPAAASAVPLANLDLQRQQLALGQQISGAMGAIESPNGAPPVGVPTLPPSTSSALPAARPAPPVRVSGGGDNGQTIMGAVTPLFGEENAGRVSLAISKRLGLDPNAPLPPDKFAQVQQFAQSVAGARQQTAPAPPAQMGAPPRGSPPTTQDPEIQQQIARYTQIASNPALPDAVRKVAQSRLDALQKSAEPTGAMKEYDLGRRQGDPGTFQQSQTDSALNKSRAEEQGKLFVKRYESITETGSRALQEIPQLQLAQKLMDSPSFYSGAGEPYNLALKRIAVALGATSAEAAAPQEAFRKIVSGSILQGLKGLQGVGQIRVAEINLLKNAAASTENTPAANRILLTSAQRLNERNAAIADMAQSYKGGNIDSGFDRQVAEYDRAHPLFSDKEVGDFRKIISPGAGGNARPAPRVGDIVSGHRFKGGDPRNKANWEPTT